MFETLSNSLDNVFKKVGSRGKLHTEDIEQTLKEVRLSLLSADVNFKIVKDFVANLKEKLQGQEIQESFTPKEFVVKYVRDELLNLFGQPQTIKRESFTKIMLVGLQGGGKTTSCAKLALKYKKQGAKPLLVGADIYRPAAVKQLEVLAKQIGVNFFSLENEKPEIIVQKSIDYAKNNNLDFVLIDTAGRLHIDEEMMAEVSRLKEILQPQEILFVLDCMLGQDAVNQAKTFNETLKLTGIILTKLDGDARGGAALSACKITNCPIKFMGVGEKLTALESFIPERLVSQILGMGDVLGLIEKIEENIDKDSMDEMEKRLRKGDFTLDDFYRQLQQVKKLGPLTQVLEMIPGFSKLKAKQNIEVDEKDFKAIEAIINSMTKKEKLFPEIIDASRKRRIAAGCGKTVQEINTLLKQFQEMKKMLKQLTGIRRLQD